MAAANAWPDVGDFRGYQAGMLRIFQKLQFPVGHPGEQLPFSFCPPDLSRATALDVDEDCQCCLADAATGYMHLAIMIAVKAVGNAQYCRPP